jgi:hypothetical protein
MSDHLDEYFNQKTPLVEEYIHDMVVHHVLAVSRNVIGVIGPVRRVGKLLA